MKPVKNKFEVEPQDLAEKYADARLTTQEGSGEQMIRVHRVFLAALSSRLEGLFDAAKNDLVVVRNISFEVLSAIIGFLYTGKVNLSDRTPDFIEDFRDGLNMLKVVISDKAERRIAEELKEVRLKYESKQEDLNENQKRPREHSAEKRLKKVKPTVVSSPMKVKGSGQKGTNFAKVKRELEEVPSRDLRGVIVDKKIGQVRYIQEQDLLDIPDLPSYNSGSKIRYIFNPRRPLADPAWPADQQVMIGPLPGAVTFPQLVHAVKHVGQIVHRIYLQFDDRLRPMAPCFKHRYAYAVFGDRRDAARLVAAAAILVGGDYFRVARMEEGKDSRS